MNNNRLQQTPPRFAFGGVLLQGKRRDKRPLTKQDCLHLVLSSCLATGRRSFLHPRHRKWLSRFLQNKAKDFKIQLKHFDNKGSSLHLLLQIPDRQSYRSFIRSVTGLIARKIMKAERNSPQLKQLKLNLKRKAKTSNGDDCHWECHGFWDFRPFSNLVKNTKFYIEQILQFNNLARSNYIETKHNFSLLSFAWLAQKDSS